MFKNIKTKSDFESLNQKDKEMFKNILAGACVKQKEDNNQIVDYYNYEILEKFGLKKEDISLPKLNTKLIDIASKLKDSKDKKANEINKACEASILAGFKSASLGAEHSYESSKEDQLNLSGMKDRGTTLPLKCSSDNGTSWNWLPHTQEQLKTVFDDGVDFKLSQLQKSAMLKDQIKQATTLEALEAITWEGV